MDSMTIIQTVFTVISTVQGFYHQFCGRPDELFNSDDVLDHQPWLRSTIRLIESSRVLNDDEMKWLQQLKDGIYDIMDFVDECKYLKYTRQIQPKLNYYCLSSTSRRRVKRQLVDRDKKNKKLLNKLNGMLASSHPLVANMNMKMNNNIRSRSNSSAARRIHGSVPIPTDPHLEELLQRQPEFRNCIAFCSIFPRGWRFDRERLVQMWMANYFIEPPERNRRWEEKCSEYFRQLESISFFIPTPTMEGRKKLYLLNDSKYDFVESISATECMRLESANIHDNIPNTIRYLSVTSNWLTERKNWKKLDLQRIRTLVVIKDPEHPLEKIENRLLRKLKKLRVLDLSECELTELPESVGELIHLRYLALCQTLISTVLPQSLAELYLLQTLHIPHEDEDEEGKMVVAELPKGMRNLIKMRHLDVNPLCISKIKGVGAMVDLKCSVEFHVKAKKGYRLEELRDLEGIGEELTIRCLENVAGKEEACKAKVKDKKRVKSLCLEWSRYRKDVQGSAMHFTDSDSEVLEGLEPSTNIEKVHIENNYGRSIPQWLREKVFHNLRCMSVTNCRHWSELPPWGGLPNLESLYIKEMSNVEHIGTEFYGRDHAVAFPRLEKLVFESMPQWTKWLAFGNRSCAFPRLKELVIINCPKLDELPPVPASVTKMEVRGTRIIRDLKIFCSGSSESSQNKLSIETSSLTVLDSLLDEEEHINNVEALTICRSEVAESELSIMLEKYKSLTSLEIIGCPNVVLIPPMRSRIALRKLHVRDCETLSSLPVLDCSLSLQALIIARCPKFSLSSLPSSNLNNLCSLKQFMISHCPEFESLPDDEFPSSLWSLYLIGCAPTLKTSLLSGTNDNWCKKISSIPQVVIR